MSRFDYLVGSGGGIGLCTFAGAYIELAKHMDLKKLKGVAGSSAGSIGSLAISLKFSHEEIKEKLMKLDFSKVRSSGLFGKLLNFFFHYGKYDGSYITKSTGELIHDKIMQEVKAGRLDPKDPLVKKNPIHITFADLHRLGCIDLHVIATKLYKVNGVPVSKEKDFSYETTPDASVPLAIRASCAAAPVIAPIRLEKVKEEGPNGPTKGKYIESINGDLFVDGGWRDHCPADVFDKIKFIDPDKDSNQRMVNYRTLLLNLDFYDSVKKKDGNVKTPIGDASWREFITASSHAFWKGYVEKEREGDSERKINIAIGDFNSFDLQINNDDKIKLMAIGQRAVKEHFENLNARYKVINREEGISGYHYGVGT